MRQDKIVSDVDIRFEAVMTYRGEDLLNARAARLLELIDERKSILAASKALGIPYSRAWELISRIERIFGHKIVRTRRGARGGGTELTDIGRILLDRYKEAESLLKRRFPLKSQVRVVEIPIYELIIAHSSDPLLSLIIERLRKRGLSVEAVCLGSGGSLAALSLGEADVACVHLFDPASEEYNTPYLPRYWLEGRVSVIGHYWRELVLALKPGLNVASLDEAFRLIADGELKIVNRNVGSGTRVYLDYLLSKYVRGDPRDRIKGYDNEVCSHLEAARAVARGDVDAGLMLRYAAELFGLTSVHVTWERYDYIALSDRMEKLGVKELSRELHSEWAANMLRMMPGYRKSMT